jgi:hypothetical protein
MRGVIPPMHIHILLHPTVFNHCRQCLFHSCQHNTTSSKQVTAPTMAIPLLPAQLLSSRTELTISSLGSELRITYSPSARSVAAGTCLPSCCLETALVYLPTSRSLHSNRSTCYNIINNGIIGYRQCGFRRNRSTTDQIFCIRQILEKKW